MIEPVTLTLAYILDLVIGDPRRLPHPVRVIGWTITKVESFLRRKIQESGVRSQESETGLKNIEAKEKWAGILLVVIIVGATYGIFYLINLMVLSSHFSLLISYFLFLCFIYLVSTTLATRELIKSAQSVIHALESDSIEEARKKLGFIVGRDTERLDRDGILKATIETLAENTSDGIIAPLFYFLIGGLPLTMAYKAINTLDSMVGYKNKRYKNIGWAAARLDDIANYIPARITGLLITISTFLIGGLKWFKNADRIGLNSLNGLNSFRTMLRDGKKHRSPNSGVPEAAMAGALGVRLGGPSIYGGIIVEKPYIGEEGQSTEGLYLKASHESVAITKITSFLGFGSALVLLLARIVLWH